MKDKLIRNKVNISYHIVGSITILSLIGINIYYALIQNSYCNIDSAIKCVEIMNKNQLTKTTLIITITYFMLYLIIDKIIDKNSSQ